MTKGTHALKKVAVAGAVQRPPADSPEHLVAVAGASGRMGQMLIEAIRVLSNGLPVNLRNPEALPRYRERFPMDEGNRGVEEGNRGIGE